MSGVLGGADRWLLVLVTMELKGVALLALCSLAALALRRHSAAGRHWVWLLAMAGLLALPFAQAMAPRWSAPLPSWTAVEVTEAPATSSGAARLAAPVDLRGEVEGPTYRKPRVAGGSLTTSGASAVDDDAPRPARATSLVREASLGSLALAVWILGTLLLLGSVAASVLATRRLAVDAPPFPAGPVTESAVRQARALGIRRRVLLLEGAPDAMPMSWGWIRPVILLPAGAGLWSRRRLESVLLHELAHVRRGDCLTQVIAELVVALHWVNPLAWIAAGRLRVEREYACDDLVLSCGTRASEYADELLSLARSFRTDRGTALAAVAMARPAHLAGRLRAVLDSTRRRRFGRLGAAGAGAVALALVTTLAALAPPRQTTSPSTKSIDGLGAPTGPVRSGPSAAEARLGSGTTTAASPEPTLGVARTEGPASGIGSALTLGTQPSFRGVSVHPDPVSTAPLAVLDAMKALVRLPQSTTCGMDPDGWQNVSSQSNNGRRRVEWSKPGCDVEVRFDGDIEFNDAFTEVSRLDRDGSFSIEERDGRARRRLEITSGSDGRPKYLYSVDQKDQAFDQGARAWYQGMLVQLFRRTGFMAHERAHAILQQGGVPALLRELDQLTSDYGFATYVQELLKQADLSDAQALDVVKRARDRVDSDYYMASILNAFAPKHLTSPEMVDQYLDAASSMDSDHYRAQVLETALKPGNLSTAEVASVVSSASDMDSDYYIATVLTEVARQYKLEPDMRSAYLKAVTAMDSDYYRATVLGALMKRNDLSDAELAVVLKAAATIGSATYAANVLEEVADRSFSSDELRAAYLQVALGIDSDYQRAQVLSRLVEKSNLTTEQVVDVVAAAAKMESDYYKSTVLLDVVRRYKLEGAARQAVIDAMNTIESEHYRGQVAQAILRK